MEDDARQLEMMREKHSRAVKVFKDVKSYLGSGQMDKLYATPGSLDAWDDTRAQMKREADWAIGELKTLFNGPLN